MEFILGDCLYGAGADTRAHGVGNRIVRAGGGAATAFFALCVVYVCALRRNSNCAKRARGITLFGQTALAVIRHRKTADRAAFAGSRQNGYNVAVLLIRQILALSGYKAFSYNLAFTIDAAAERRQRARNNVIGYFFDILLQCPFIGIFGYSSQYFKFQLLCVILILHAFKYLITHILIVFKKESIDINNNIFQLFCPSVQPDRKVLQ